MATTDVPQRPVSFDPAAFTAFRFTDREIDQHGRVRLQYALDDQIAFVEELDLPIAKLLSAAERERVDGLLGLLHWIAGVSYYKTAIPRTIECDTGAPPPAVARLLEALYSEGLGEFAYRNGLSSLPAPAFPIAREATNAAERGADGELAAAGRGWRDLCSGDLRFDRAPPDEALPHEAPPHEAPPRRVLVPIGGGKDSIVALEAVRRSGAEMALFSVGNAFPIARTAAVAGLPHLICERRLDPHLLALNEIGALNGHVPVTAIVSCAALLTAALNGFDTVAMANERSASAGNVRAYGIVVNHQFSKSIAAERLLRQALAELAGELTYFSILRGSSELAIARAFARLSQYHSTFTSCNTAFRLDPSRRGNGWCCDCPKCRFVFLMLAPFCEPAHMREIFGCDMLDDESQYPGFAALAGAGEHKPFECVGETGECLIAIDMLSRQPAWREHRVVRRLVAEVMPAEDRDHRFSDPHDPAFTLSAEHFIPDELLGHAAALLAA